VRVGLDAFVQDLEHYLSFLFALPLIHVLCTQEVMFVSSNYAILASPGRIVSTPSRTSQGNFPKSNKVRVLPGTRPRGFGGLWTSFAVACCLMAAASGLGSGGTTSASEAFAQVRHPYVISPVNDSGQATLFASAVPIGIRRPPSLVVKSWLPNPHDSETVTAGRFVN
jgi:hypothetical protein